MKALFTLLALMLCVTVRADVAEVKKLMDEPVPMTGAIARTSAVDSVYTKEITRLEELLGKSKIYRGFEYAPRHLFTALAQQQGHTSTDLRILNELAKVNAAKLRTALLPAFKDAGLIAAASDLEEALKSVEASKTLERGAQDRFARLAMVAR